MAEFYLVIVKGFFDGNCIEKSVKGGVAFSGCVFLSPSQLEMHLFSVAGCSFSIPYMRTGPI